jgi:hypothetical protein
VTPPPDPAARPGRGRVLTTARRAYTLLLVAALAWAVALARDDLVDLVRGSRPGLLVAALVASTGMLLLSSALWSSALRSLGSPVPALVVLSTTARSLPARYLPGSIWYAVSRAGLLRERGVPLRALTTVATVEMVLTPVVGFALGGCLLAASGRTGPALTAPLAVAVAALALVATPPVLNRVLALAWRRRGGGLPRLGWPAVGRLVGWLVVFWVWSGSVFALYLQAFPRVLGEEVPPLVVPAAYMVAWGVGWLAVFAPQGVGVFEVTLASTLGVASAGVALILGGYRVVVLTRDLLAAGTAAWLQRRARSRR